MRVREVAGGRGLVARALALVLLSSCGSGPAPVPKVRLDDSLPPSELRKVLESIARRDDYEALWARARIYARLREAEPASSQTSLILGDAADVEILSRVAPPEYKAESALRLARHFRERAETPALCRTTYPGKAGDPLRKVALLTAAAFFGECGSREEFIVGLERLAAAEEVFARDPSLGSEGQQHWVERSTGTLRRAAALRQTAGRPEPSAEARKFCEYDAQRHLEEGTRAADFGTREKAARRELEGVVGWYVLALAHFAVVRETMMELTGAQQHGLAVQEIVVRSLCDLLCREP